MAFNWVLALTALVVVVMLIICSLYIVVYFQSDNDKNTAYFPKGVVVLAFTLACVNVLMLPLDVGNQSSQGGLDMKSLWYGVYLADAVMCVLIIPFSIFYYEGEDGSGESGNTKQIKQAVCWTFTVFFVFSIVFLISYFLWNDAEVPYKNLISEPMPYTNDLNFTVACGSRCAKTSEVMEVPVTLFVYLISFVSIVGWVLFVLFGGIGLTALPMDLINEYRSRPKPIELAEYAERKASLGDRATKLIQTGEKMNLPTLSTKTRSQKKQFNKFKKAVYLLEREFENLQVAYKQRGGSPLFWWFCLFIGVIGVVISICWVLQIVLYMLMDYHPFLNIMFVKMEKTFGLLGTVSYGVFAFWLLWCVIKGNFKFGLRLLFIPIYPMRLGDTLMTSMLFNAMLVLFASVAVTQFCAQAFNQYTRLTAADVIFRTQMSNLKGLSYFWQYYIYAFLVLAGLAFLYLLLFPKDKAKKYIKSLDDVDE